ncbi:MAG: hypothetical protein EA397_15795 [Deltaproteobacteria bacterium]|nr:MAG: hypothetical protein EA397_15795 [Deltaproteobacteria bacterium]
MRRIFILLAATALTACGGISNSRLVVDLDESQLQALCHDLASEMPERTTMCGDDDFSFEITVGIDPDECDEDMSDADLAADCEATVGDYRACLRELYDDPCGEDMPPECEPLFTCFEE